MNAEDPLLELRNARVVRNGRTILSVDHLVLNEGEHVAVLGPNGSGKSTLVGLLTRDVRPLHASEPPVRFRGEGRSPLFDVRRVLGVVSSDLQDVHRRGLTVQDVVLSGFFGSIGLHLTQHATEKMLGRSRRLMDEMGVVAFAGRTMDTLSTGEARRVLIARALVHDPAVLVLDEPCDGLDPSAAFRVLRTVQTLATSGRSVLLVTHHVDDIVPEIDRVVMLRDGRIVSDSPKSEALTSENLADLYGVPPHVEERNGWYRLWWEERAPGEGAG